MINIQSKKIGRIRIRQRLGKYKVEKLLAEGPFASVYQAYDTIEGTRVALKIPHAYLMDKQFLEEFRKEVRMAARLDHNHILHVKNASIIDAHFVIVFPLGDETLDDRMQRRMAPRTALDFAEQALEALAYAHSKRIIHCDIKPDNFLIFRGHHLRLTDFGIAKIALHTMEASGSGTIGYIAPEQAMGKPSLHSDVFSMGLVLYRMFSGSLPHWPFDWPPPGYDRLRERMHPDFIQFIRRAMDVRPSKRHKDAVQMLAEFSRLKRHAVKSPEKRRRKKTAVTPKGWEEVRQQQFKRQYGKQLETRYACRHCRGPVAETMRACPWCGTGRIKHAGTTPQPAQCPRCNRGIKLDWLYCPWCFGAGFGDASTRAYTDKRYQARCENPGCSRKLLMPFMKYCPWCHRAVQRPWKINGSRDTCPSCKWGVLGKFWDFCPWCSKALHKPKKAKR